jgi:excisionase family DNA binding protein
MTLDLKDRLYTSSEVAEILGVSLRSVYRYLEEGKLDADIKTATGRHRFSKKNILDFLQPGGITKENPEDVFRNSDEDEFNVLDLPAISKSKKVSDNEEDSFSFDLDEDFFKSLNFDEAPSKESLDLKTSQSPKVEQGDYIDDDLEKLLREFEEKEGFSESSTEKEVGQEPNSIKKSSDKDDFDFDLDSFFKDLEDETNLKNIEIDQPSVSSSDNFKQTQNTQKTEDDFDFDFDLSFLDNLENNSRPEISKSMDVDKTTNPVTSPKVEEEDNEDNWLERFRKAAQKNSSPSHSESTKDSLKETFFEKSSLDHFFDNVVDKEETSTIGFGAAEKFESENNVVSRSKEYHYSSSLNGLKEIAQNIDKIARKFDTDYAFTLNAGLSLHKPISPFSLIHTYVRGRDLELFEDYLNLTPVDNKSEASVCLIVADDSSIFEDAYELHGLYVVSNVQLRSDLIDKGLDKLAREI